MNARKEKVDRRRVRAWMVMQGLRAQDIQVALGHRYHSPVVETLHGSRNHRKVLAWLEEKGCPVEYLELPSDKREKI
jgi:hypothetical protein